MNENQFSLKALFAVTVVAALFFAAAYYIGPSTVPYDRLGSCSERQLIRWNYQWYQKACDCDDWPTALGYSFPDRLICEGCQKKYLQRTEAEVRFTIDEWEHQDLPYGYSGTHGPGDWWPTR